MKKILFCISLFVFGLSTVYCDCTDSDVEQYKKEASSINVSYERDKDATDAFDAPVYDAYIVTIKNLYDNYYIEDNKSGIKIGKDYLYEGETAENNTYVSDALSSGVKKLKVYHNGCSTVIKTIELKLPVYNVYNEDPLCDNVNKSNVKVCDKWLENQITYEEFYNEVSKYKEENNTNKNFTNNVLDFFKNNYITVIVAVLIFALIVVLASVIKKKRPVV